jgi:hypothetical protein
MGEILMKGETRMSEDRNMTIPKSDEAAKENNNKKEPITQEESEYIEKVFFEEDETVRLRDGKTYRIPPLSVKDARRLMKLLNTIDTAIIISNLIAEDGENDRYDELMEVLLMAFKPYYKHVTVEYLAEYVDLVIAKQIIDAMIGLNGLKKLL